MTLNRIRPYLLALTLIGFFIPTLASANNHELLVYCGITMVKPISELAKNFEKQHNAKVIITQGGSEDLYNSLKMSRKGDIYLPGEPSFRARFVSEGLLGNFKTIGYNQASLMVRKGNPKKVSAEVNQLLRTDLAVMIAAETQGSIGAETKRILTQAGIYERAVDNASQLSPDSRAINASLKKGEADVAINWRATAFFAENSPYIDAIDLPTKVAEPQALLMNLVTISQHKALAQAFIDYVAGSEGQAIMRKHGFLDNNTKVN